MNTNQNETIDLSLQGTAIQPATSSSRPSSARTNSQSKQQTTPSREGKRDFSNILERKNILSLVGNVSELQTNMNTSGHLSSARQR